ncbi:MAG: hypothetical protein RMZ41_030225 [Nostoc sp. DedVER02]|uniref:hypothetical protein n=1 Tax=unclassified Nostoc TaxID=2593658 RepID=UPI002AD548AB|nr:MULTISPECIES: hypothetical protein [unclassified Nostoc]MDZ7990565.1 hypothetical protein [Nostoc sp. DedVER02]MDZ8115077.1 hypothetical protein [Nostoc sp. DedVER01b]
MVAASQFKPRQAEDAINRRLYKRLIIVETAIYRVFLMIYRVFLMIYRVFLMIYRAFVMIYRVFVTKFIIR